MPIGFDPNRNQILWPQESTEDVQAGNPTGMPKTLPSGRVDSFEITNPIPMVDPYQRLEILGHAPTEMITDTTDAMLTIGGLTEDYFPNITQQEIEANPNDFWLKAKHLVALTYQVMLDYSESGLLPVFGIRRIVNEMRNGNDAQAIRIDLNITDFNTLDTSGGLGDTYIPEFGDFLIETIKNDPELFRLFGRQPAIIRLPERTSFVIIGGNSEAGKYLVKVVNERLHQLREIIIPRLKIAQAEGRIPPDVLLEDVLLSATVHHSVLQLKDFTNNYVRENNLPDRKAIPEKVLLDHALTELVRLAAETTYLRAHPDITPDFAIGGFRVYGSDAIPKVGTHNYESIRYMLEGRRGFIPPGSFGYEAEKDPELRARFEYPDIPMNLGEVSRPKHLNGGGLIENFIEMTLMLRAHPSIANYKPFMDEYVGTVKFLGSYVLNIGDDARRDPRYPSCMRNEAFAFEQTAVQESYFGVKYDYVAAVEVDDGRAFGMKYPTKDFVDGDFQMVKKLIFETAFEMGMYSPVVTANGDQIRVFFSTTAVGGEKISAKEFLEKYQARIKEYFASKPFQAYAKIKDKKSGKTDRVPVWIDSKGRTVVSKIKKPGYKPYTKGLTVSVAYHVVGALSTVEDVFNVRKIFFRAFSYIDNVLKTQRGEFVKEGLGELPKDYTKGEEKAELSKPEKLRRKKGGKTKKRVSIRQRRDASGKFGTRKKQDDSDKKDLQPVMTGIPIVEANKDVIDVNQFRPPVIRGIYKTAEGVKTFVNGARDVAGGALLGGTTFLFAEKIVDAIIPNPPETKAEAVVRGYDVLGLAVVLERVANDLIQKSVWGKYAMQAASFGFKEFFSGLGVALVACNGIDKIAKEAGASDETAKLTSIFGTGMLFGGTRELAKKVLSESAFKYAAEVMTGAGSILFVADLANKGIDIGLDYTVDNFAIQAEAERRYLGKKWMNDRSLFGDAENVPWYEQIYHTAEGVVDVVTPEVYYKSMNLLFPNKWQEQCEAFLKSGGKTCIR